MRTGSFIMIDPRQLGMVATTSLQEVDNQVGLDVTQDQAVPDEAIFELGREIREFAKQRRRKRRQRNRGRIDGVDVHLHVLGQLGDDRLAIGGRAALEVVLDDLDEVRLVFRREDLAGLGAGAQRHDHLAERLLAIGDLLRIVGLLEVRDLAFGLVVNLHVGVDALLELERRGALRVDALAVGGDRGSVHGRRAGTVALAGARCA